MESPDNIEDEDVAEEEISEEKQICDNNAILNSIDVPDNIDVYHTLNNNNSNPNHPTFFSSFNELSMNNNNNVDEGSSSNSNNMKNKNMTASSSSDHQKEESDFHSVLSYLCHATPCFSLRPSGLDKALRLRSLSFPSVFIDEEMQRSFNDIVFGQDSHLEENDVNKLENDVNTTDIEISTKIDVMSSSCNEPESNEEWKTIPIQREDIRTDQIQQLDGSVKPSSNIFISKSLDYFDDYDFRAKMNDVLLTHHGDLIDQKNIETLKTKKEANDDNFLLDESKTGMTGHIISSQQQQTNDNMHGGNDKTSNNQSQQREILSFADDNFVELTQDFHTPLRFTYQNDYFKDENFVRQMKNLWKHYHHSLDDSSINTSPSRQSWSTSRTTNTLSPSHSLSSLASAFSHTYSGASVTSGGGTDAFLRHHHDFGSLYNKHHRVRSKHFLKDKVRRAPKRGHTISNIIYDCAAFEDTSHADNCPEEAGDIEEDASTEAVGENDIEKVEFRKEPSINVSIQEDIATNIANETDPKDDLTADYRKKKKKSKNRIRSATSGAFNYMKKMKPKSIEEDQATVPNMMLGEERHGDLTDEDGGN